MSLLFQLLFEGYDGVKENDGIIFVISEVIEQESFLVFFAKDDFKEFSTKN